MNKKVDILLLVVFAVAFGFLLFEKYLQCGTLSGSWVHLDGDYQRIGTLVMAGTFFAFFSRRKFANVKLNKIFEFVSLRSINIYIIHMFLCWAWVIHVYPRIPISNIGMHFVRTVIVVVVAILILEPISLIPGVNTLLGLKNHWKKEIRTSDSKGINKGK